MVGPKLKRLFYIAGMVATAAELEEAQRLGFTALRNAAEANRSTILESADVVAGLVPDGYRKMRGCKVIESSKPQEAPVSDDELERLTSPAKPQGKGK